MQVSEDWALQIRGRKLIFLPEMDPCIVSYLSKPYTVIYNIQNPGLVKMIGARGLDACITHLGTMRYPHGEYSRNNYLL